MESDFALEQETEKFIDACEVLHARLASGPLPSHDRDAILMTAHDLLTNLHS